jgi:peptide subunit release factor 1 (eRF1)
MTIRADRAGADIAVYRRERLTAERETGGGTDPLARSKPGGWSQRRYQQRAENTWEQNAEDTALDVTRLFERFDPRLIVLAGDERAVQLIEEALPTTVLDRLVVVEGGRSEDGSDDLFAGRVQEQVTAAVNLDTYMLLEKFREELGQADRAADGPDDVLAALARAQVEVLLVHDSPADERTALFGPEPAQVGRAADDLRAMGVDEPQEARLVDVAVRAALGTGAGVRILPDGDVPTGRLGAILRWS